MTKAKPNNGYETKSEIFSMDIFKSDIIFHCSKNTEIVTMTFIIDIFQLHCKSEHKQVK